MKNMVFQKLRKTKFTSHLKHSNLKCLTGGNWDPFVDTCGCGNPLFNIFGSSFLLVPTNIIITTILLCRYKTSKYLLAVAVYCTTEINSCIIQILFLLFIPFPRCISYMARTFCFDTTANCIHKLHLCRHLWIKNRSIFCGFSG